MQERVQILPQETSIIMHIFHLASPFRCRDMHGVKITNDWARRGILSRESLRGIAADWVHQRMGRRGERMTRWGSFASGKPEE